jgi:RsiW-degrading membrane proteinase PrsW (M82 family)
VIVNDLRQMDLRGEIVPIDESNLFPLIHDEVFWSVALLGIVPLLIVTFPDTDVQVTAFALFFAAVWGVIFRSAILKHNASWKILLPSLFFTGLLGTTVAGMIEKLLLPLLVHGYGTAFLGFIVVIGVFEELAKFAPVACYLLWKRSAANPMTIILVGVFSGLGFAAFENLVYSQNRRRNGCRRNPRSFRRRQGGDGPDDAASALIGFLPRRMGGHVCLFSRTSFAIPPAMGSLVYCWPVRIGVAAWYV